MKKYISVMVQNTKRLLELTGQLLDFQKIGANKLTMKFESVDITELLAGIVARFEVTFSLNRKELQLKSTEEQVWAAVDKEAITKILSNLLNNALKYASQDVLVELEKGEDSFTIRVTSDGNKIPAEVSQYIFEPFYQVDRKEKPRNGVGIGLSLARSLASLHKGTIYLDTNQENNVFVLTIPLNMEGMKLENHKTIQKDIVKLDQHTPVTTDIYGYTLLLVEDNESMVTFIHERLQENFTVETAMNGVEALEILRSSHIDLIISDIMMPVMDGIECCKRLKSELQTSHIPVLMLTAYAMDEQRIQGYDSGADSYLTKPFNAKLLLARIRNLIDNRKRLKSFTEDATAVSGKQSLGEVDKGFVEKLKALIEEKMSNSDLSVEDLGAELGLGRVQLYRKTKSLTGYAPNELLRIARLKKAASLLASSEKTVAEITYEVGFSSPSYFTRCYKDYFGESPSEFLKRRDGKN